MKKRTKIFLGILILLLFVCAGLLLWQWGNINALRCSVTMTPEEIQAQLDANQKKMSATMEQYQVPQEALREETIDQILSGELNLQDAVRDFLNRDLTEGSSLSTDANKGAQEPSDSEMAAPSDTYEVGQTEEADSSERETAPDSPDARIQEELAALYILQAVYEGRLEAMAQEAVAAYRAREGSSRDIEAAKMGQVIALEAECDQQIYAIIKNIRELLKAAGQDASLANEVETYYLAEKNMKKAQYIQRYRS